MGQEEHAPGACHLPRGSLDVGARKLSARMATLYHDEDTFEPYKTFSKDGHGITVCCSPLLG